MAATITTMTLTGTATKSDASTSLYFTYTSQDKRGVVNKRGVRVSPVLPRVVFLALGAETKITKPNANSKKRTTIARLKVIY